MVIGNSVSELAPLSLRSLPPGNAEGKQILHMYRVRAQVFHQRGFQGSLLILYTFGSLNIILLQIFHSYSTSLRPLQTQATILQSVARKYTLLITTDNVPRKTTTMLLAALICFCISTTNAVKHYGMIPSEDMYNTVQEHAKKFLENDMELVSVFTTDNHHIHNGSDFLSEIGIYDKTVDSIFAPSIHNSGESAIGARAAVNGECQGHGNIQDNLSDAQIKLICGTLAGSANAVVHTIIEVVESKVCTEAGTGHPLPSCKDNCWIN